jgi:hypothetical protein
MIKPAIELSAIVKYEAMYRTQTTVAQVCGVVPATDDGCCCDMTGSSRAKSYRWRQPESIAS